MPQRILAIELAGDSVRCALAERSWNSPTMIEALEERREGEEPDLAAALACLLADSGKPDLVVSATPGALVGRPMLSSSPRQTVIPRAAALRSWVPCGRRCSHTAPKMRSRNSF